MGASDQYDGSDEHAQKPINAFWTTLGGEAAEWLYLPLTLVDQAVRPNYWNPTREEEYILDR